MPATGLAHEKEEAHRTYILLALLMFRSYLTRTTLHQRILFTSLLLSLRNRLSSLLIRFFRDRQEA